jgi:hypothetical protein
VLAPAALLAAAVTTGTYGACPQDVCDCLGEARNFALVTAGSQYLGIAREFGGGERTTYGTEVGDVCAHTAKSTGFVAGPNVVDGDLVALAGTGTALRFFTYDPYDSYGGSDPGLRVEGTVATGGGRVIGDIDTDTPVDTSGTHPKLASCRQAIADMQSASAVLAGLAPTQDVGPIRVRGDVGHLTAGPGVNVFAASQVRVVPDDPLFGYGALEIDMHPDTEAVIINTRGLYLGPWTEIGCSNCTGKVIINVYGGGPSVNLSFASFVGAVILAPERAIKAEQWAWAVSLLARQARLRGSEVGLPWYCP